MLPSYLSVSHARGVQYPFLWWDLAHQMYVASMVGCNSWGTRLFHNSMKLALQTNPRMRIKHVDCFWWDWHRACCLRRVAVAWSIGHQLPPAFLIKFLADFGRTRVEVSDEDGIQYHRWSVSFSFVPSIATYRSQAINELHWHAECSVCTL